jgi:hypothetical protein
VAKFTLELSDGLAQLSDLFVPYQHEPMMLDPEDARTIRRCIKKLRDAARSLENEASRLKWNEPTLRQQIAEGRRVAAEIERQGSNVVPFPPRPRPFSDGYGGAA